MQARPFLHVLWFSRTQSGEKQWWLFNVSYSWFLSGEKNGDCLDGGTKGAVTQKKHKRELSATSPRKMKSALQRPSPEPSWSPFLALLNNIGKTNKMKIYDYRWNIRNDAEPLWDCFLLAVRSQHFIPFSELPTKPHSFDSNWFSTCADS